MSFLQEGLKIHFVEDYHEVFDIAFGGPDGPPDVEPQAATQGAPPEPQGEPKGGPAVETLGGP